MTIVLLLAAGLYAEPAASRLRIDVDRETGTATVIAVNADLSRLIEAAELRSGIFVQGSVPETTVSMALRNVPLKDLTASIVREAGLTARRSGTALVLETSVEPTVSIDVVEADARSIIGTLARQCGIRNVMVDPEVDTKATLLLRDVACSTAFRVAFSTLGLEAEVMPSSVLVASVPR